MSFPSLLKHKYVSASFSVTNLSNYARQSIQLISEIDCTLRDNAPAHFYDRWKDDQLVTDKWFVSQVMSSLPGTLDAVKVLLKHPAFNLANPNGFDPWWAALA